MKKTKKIIGILTFIILVVTILTNISYASGMLGLYNGTDPGTNGKDEIKSIINIAIGVVQVVGIFIAIAMLIFLGIKYMVASPGEKAEIKKHITTYVIGAIVLFGAAGILEMIKTIAIDVTA